MKVAPPEERREPWDWPAIDRHFWRECGMTPAQVERLTLPEIVTLLERPEAVQADDVIRETVDAYRRLSLKEKLLAARDG